MSVPSKLRKLAYKRAQEALERGYIQFDKDYCVAIDGKQLIDILKLVLNDEELPVGNPVAAFGTDLPEGMSFDEDEDDD